jgi:hypothetical protein|tara:strand:- start:825 stop:995 length:171 start_codon:yes stop_codon:yes gene_type:complete
MKIGDIIQYTGFKKALTGIVIETGMYTGNNDILVMWQDGAIFPEKSEMMVALRETR